MTTSHHTERLDVEDVEQAVAAVRSAGLRMSSARRLLIEALFAAEGPITAEEIATGLGGRLPRSDEATVYRNLETLESIGLVRHVHLGHGPGLYAPARAIAAGYVVCDSCGARLAASGKELEPVREAVRHRFGYEASFDHFPIVGLCPDCLAKSPQADPAQDA